ncbi:unnamed protein product, partial [Didymodactylos carnosus]
EFSKKFRQKVLLIGDGLQVREVEYLPQLEYLKIQINVRYKKLFEFDNEMDCEDNDISENDDDYNYDIITDKLLSLYLKEFHLERRILKYHYLELLIQQFYRSLEHTLLLSYQTPYWLEYPVMCYVDSSVHICTVLSLPFKFEYLNFVLNNIVNYRLNTPQGKTRLPMTSVKIVDIYNYVLTTTELIEFIKETCPNITILNILRSFSLDYPFSTKLKFANITKLRIFIYIIR